jgi:hypothetical protein
MKKLKELIKKLMSKNRKLKKRISELENSNKILSKKRMDNFDKLLEIAAKLSSDESPYDEDSGLFMFTITEFNAITSTPFLSKKERDEHLNSVLEHYSKEYGVEIKTADQLKEVSEGNISILL